MSKNGKLKKTQKMQDVWALHRQTIPIRAIGQELNVPASTVHYWITKMRKAARWEFENIFAPDMAMHFWNDYLFRKREAFALLLEATTIKGKIACLEFMRKEDETQVKLAGQLGLTVLKPVIEAIGQVIEGDLVIGEKSETNVTQQYNNWTPEQLAEEATRIAAEENRVEAELSAVEAELSRYRERIASASGPAVLPRNDGIRVEGQQDGHQSTDGDST